MSDFLNLVPYWKNLKKILNDKSAEEVVAVWREWLSTNHLILPHPYIEGLKTYARRSYMPFLGWGNLVFFNDEKGDNGWFLYQAYNICDSVFFNGSVEVIAKENRVWKDGVFDTLIFKETLDHMLKMGRNELLYKETRLLLEHARPYHFIYEQLSNLDILQEVSSFELEVSERAPFLSASMLGYETCSVDEESYVYLLPLMFVHYRKKEGREYAKEMERRVINACNAKPKEKPSNVLRIWFGITGVKRSWVEQVSACVALAEALLKKHEFVEFLIDGMTASQGGNNFFKEDEAVFNEISLKLSDRKRVNLIKLIGNTYSEKIKEISKCDYFVANSGSGAMVPVCFSKVPGCIHGIIDTFEVERKESKGRVVFLKKISIPLMESKNKASINYSLSVEDFLDFVVKDIGEHVVYHKLDAINSRLVDDYRKADLLRDLALYFEGKKDLSTALKIMLEARLERPNGPLIEKKIHEYSIALNEEAKG